MLLSCQCFWGGALLYLQSTLKRWRPRRGFLWGGRRWRWGPAVRSERPCGPADRRVSVRSAARGCTALLHSACTQDRPSNRAFIFTHSIKNLTKCFLQSKEILYSPLKQLHNNKYSKLASFCTKTNLLLCFIWFLSQKYMCLCRVLHFLIVCYYLLFYGLYVYSIFIFNLLFYFIICTCDI